MRSTPWYLLAVLTAVNAINWADRQVVPILFPGIREDLGLSDTELGIVGGLAFSLVYALSSFFFGHAADRGIRRNLILFGLVVWSAATAAGGLAVGFGSLVAARFLTGIGEASLYPCAMSLLAERVPAHLRGRAMGVFGMASAVGGGVGIGLGGALAGTYGWRTVFFLYGAVGLLLVPLLVGLPESRRPVIEGDDHSVRRVLPALFRDLRLQSMWIAGMVMIASGLGYVAWIPSYFIRERGFDVAQSGTLFGASLVIGGVVGSLLGGIGADYGRRRRFAGELDISVLAAVSATPLTLLALTAESTFVFVTASLLAPIAVFAFFPALQTMVVELVPARSLGLAYAVNILYLGGIGSAAGPFIVGAVSDRTGDLGAAIMVPVVGTLVAGVLMLVAGRAIRTRTPPAVAAVPDQGTG